MRHRSILLFFAILLCVQETSGQDTTWFSNATEKTGLQGVKGFRINIVDIDNDDYPDLLLENGLSIRSRLTRILLNRPKPGSTDPRERHFVDVTDASGIFAHPGGDSSRVIDIATMADLNNDGNIDLVTGTYFDRLEAFGFPDDRCEVMLGDGTGKFTLVPNNGLHELGLINTAGFTFLDYDRDGKVDLYISTWFADKTNNFMTNDILMRGNGDGTFTDVTAGAGVGDIFYPMYGASAADWNNDGLVDIFTSPYCRSGGSLWRNNGDGTFTDVAIEANYSSQHMSGDVDGSGPRALCQWAAQPADFDNDGDLDLAQIFVHGGLAATEGRSTITTNGGAGNGYRLEWDLNRLVRDQPRSSHLGDQDGWWIDVDNDGLLDLAIAQCVYQAATDRTYIFHQKPDHSFADITAEVGLSYLKETHNVRPFDYDLDGDEDLLVEIWRKNNQVVSEIVLVENRIGATRNWSSVKLVAPAGVNGSAIGARVTLYSGGSAQIREVAAGQGHFGAQSPLIKLFGMGSRQTIDSLVVRWPSASQPNTVVVNPPINTMLVIGAQGLLSSVRGNDRGSAELSVRPNPVDDLLHIDVPGIRGSASIELYDGLGFRVRSIDVAAGATMIALHLDGLPAGLYVVRLIEEGAVTRRTFFIKQ